MTSSRSILVHLKNKYFSKSIYLKKNKAFLILFAAVIIVAYQNCQRGFSTNKSNGQLSSSNANGFSGIVATATSTSAVTAVSYVRGSGNTHKICQLIGNTDFETNRPTLNQTFTKAGIWGEDLGVSWMHNGKLWFFFGDLWTSSTTYNNSDAFGWTTTTDPEKCININFITDSSGSFHAVQPPGVDMGGWNVPLTGFDWAGAEYIFVSTGNMTSSVLTKTLDDGHSYQTLYTFSSDHFINVSAYVVNNSTDNYVYLFGSGKYRNSPPYLARVQASEIENKNAIQFYSGMASGQPVWSNSEAAAIEVFNQTGIGELSAQYIPQINQWMMLYNNESPRGINMRTASFPWGPWSDVQVIMDPFLDNAYGNYMFDLNTLTGAHNPNATTNWGGEYGPYLIPSYTKDLGSSIRIYYTMSTWNPYTVVLMATDLEKNVSSQSTTSTGTSSTSGAWTASTSCSGTTQVVSYSCQGGNGQCATSQPASSSKVNSASCGYTEITGRFMVGQGIYYDNGQGHYCWYKSWDYYLNTCGFSSDTSTLLKYSSIPTGITYDGTCVCQSPTPTATPAPTPAPATPVSSSTALQNSCLMNSGIQYVAGQGVKSYGGQYTFIVQNDGNVVLYGPSGALWATNTAGQSISALAMQGDGNLVLYSLLGQALWASNTAGNPGARLAVQDDGNLVIYSISGKVLWARK